MWLINARNQQLEEYVPELCPPYAILSHRWGSEETTFQDMTKSEAQRRRKQGYTKIESVCFRALEDGLEYAWVDTCCINKESSAELSEAINSMFNWYAKAKLCYVYLSDVSVRSSHDGDFEDSAWFSRGWTLQELLAPKHVIFFDEEWFIIGTKKSLVETLNCITSIDVTALQGQDLSEFHVAQKMSWASKRQTTRVEDMAYSLMGIFDVNMPLLYGEGAKAFRRLQEEIIKNSDDVSIFAWTQVAPGFSGPFATSPADFTRMIYDDFGLNRRMPSFEITNRGVSLTISLSMLTPSIYLAHTGFRDREWCSDEIALHRLSGGLWERVHGYEPISPDGAPACIWRDWNHMFHVHRVKERCLVVGTRDAGLQNRKSQFLEDVLSERFSLIFTTPKSWDKFFSQVATQDSCRELWADACKEYLCTHKVVVPTNCSVIYTELQAGEYGFVAVFTSHQESLNRIGFGFDFDGQLFLLATTNYRFPDLAYNDVAQRYDLALKQYGSSLQEILIQRLIDPDYSDDAISRVYGLRDWLQFTASTRWNSPEEVQSQSSIYPSSDGIWAIKLDCRRDIQLALPSQEGEPSCCLLQVEQDKIPLSSHSRDFMPEICIRFWDPEIGRLENPHWKESDTFLDSRVQEMLPNLVYS